jgi:hypothetical protein
MPNTGDICQDSGIYKVIEHINHPREITMVRNNVFPPCSKCKNKVKYELVRKTKH